MVSMGGKLGRRVLKKGDKCRLLHWTDTGNLQFAVAVKVAVPVVLRVCKRTSTQLLKYVTTQKANSFNA